MHDRELTHSSHDGPREGQLVLQLDGPITLSNLFGFQDDFRSLKPPTLIVDMTNVPYMDSAGLGLLLNHYISSEKAGRRLALVGVVPRIMTLFEVSRVDKILAIFPTVQAAFESLP